MIIVFHHIVHPFYERARLLCSRTHHQEEEWTVEVHPIRRLTPVVLPHTGDELLHYKLASI